MKTKILYICPNGYLGGAERFICNIALGHQKYGNDSFEVLFFSTGSAFEYCKEINAKTHLLPIKFRLKNVFSLLKVLIWIRRLIKKNEFNTIHATMPYAHIISFLSSFFLPVKRVWFQHGPVGGTLDKIANLLPVDQILFNSKFLEAEHLKMFYSKRRKKIHKIIHLGAPELSVKNSISESLREEFLKNSKKTLILSAGRLCPWKGQDTIIKAFARLKEKSPELFKNLILLIVGDIGREEDAPYRNSLRTLVKKSQLEDSIFFTGHTDHIEKYYQAADIFIHSSNIPEPFGLTVIEAMKYKALVIGSHRGGVTDILIDGQTGYQFDAISKDAPFILEKVLTKALVKMHAKDPDIKKIKLNAFTIVSENYSIKKMTAEVEGYLELL